MYFHLYCKSRCFWRNLYCWPKILHSRREWREWQIPPLSQRKNNTKKTHFKRTNYHNLACWFDKKNQGKLIKFAGFGTKFLLALWPAAVWRLMEFWPQQTRIINEDRIKQNKNQWKIQIAKGIAEMLVQHAFIFVCCKI